MRSIFSFLVFPFAIFHLPSVSYAIDHTVIQKDKKFSVDTIDIHLGDNIIFKNEETDVIHNLYSISPGNEFELKVQPPGTWTPINIGKTKHKKGKMLVECAIHPWMKLWVNIK